MLKAIFKLFTDSKDQDIQITALKILDKEFLNQEDPNLRYIGLQTLSSDIKPEIVSGLFGKKLIALLQQEKEQSMLNLIITIMQKTINSSNYELILTSLFK